ncbi:heme peroxidase [Mycobacterium sp. TNTM28]|uniref:Heme peroxidase n=1 Tax=[Mycobacterium] fortunisiensis TaxID=2600579 RepID=A0ABS6KH42_9MYCO|nr:peptidoglycan-binding protein [[Mycobacterium] fortunisiensis]MBU9762889.1 heme peroxidase [[Mycobacterium] fortunisiensis]
MRHGRESFFVVGEGILTSDGKAAATPHLSDADELRQFRFSRIGPPGTPASAELVTALAEAITTQPPDADDDVPAGYTYLGQFVDHDMTRDNTVADLGSDLTVDELIQGRSPSLDLDSLYGHGPAADPQFYTDGLHLKMGRTASIGDLPAFDGFDLPRDPQQSTALIPDHRNDENLAVAQTHLAFIRFHNRVADTIAPGPVAARFEAAQERVVKHYQWMLRTDYLPRIVDPGIIEDVFTNGRTLFETSVVPGDAPTMPIEFSVAAFRLGHSMVRDAYHWNRIFDNGGGTLSFLFDFSGTSGSLTGQFPLPSNWIADFRRLYDFAEAGRPDLVVPKAKFNHARAIDTRLTDPLATLPAGSFGDRNDPVPPLHANLAFRNLSRANMVKLASGQQMATLANVAELSEKQLVEGAGTGVDLTGLTPAVRTEFVTNTPLWPYILREAELNGGRLTGVGGRIVAETFHRAMEGSTYSIVRDPHWRPTLGPDPLTFRMVDLLLFAFEGRADLLNPLGDETGQPAQIIELQRGDESPFVRILQHLLRARRFDLSADGVFGPVTEQAVRRFQGNQGIVVDGIVGPVTWSRLFITVRRGSTGEAVKGIQVRMNLRQAAPVAVDGAYGPVTEQAVREFQGSQGIESDGITGPVTWRRCVSTPA